MSAVAAIVLAAGASTRLGTPKQLVQLGSETLLERTVRVALEAGLCPVLTIIRSDLVLDPRPSGMIPVVNREPAEGMASSIRAGLQALATDGTHVSGAIILACDQPAVTAEHLRQLAVGRDEVIASAYAGRKGVPAYFPLAAFEALLALRGDHGARDLLKGARSIPLPGGELDIDTTQELDRARTLYEQPDTA